jgi:hypothetical protein
VADEGIFFADFCEDEDIKQKVNKKAEKVKLIKIPI